MSDNLRREIYDAAGMLAESPGPGTAADHIVELGTPLTFHFGFTADLFGGWLWIRGNIVVISFIVSKQPGKGHFSALLRTIQAQGFTVHVPSPLGAMEDIVRAKGFRKTVEQDAKLGPCDVWVSP